MRKNNLILNNKKKLEIEKLKKYFECGMGRSFCRGM